LVDGGIVPSAVSMAMPLDVVLLGAIVGVEEAFLRKFFG